jgi:diguanylate cyclase (GGDEF)-like protein
VIPKEGALAWLDCWTITRGVKKQALAEAWINYMLEKPVGRALTERQGLANTVDAGTIDERKNKIIWLEPVEDADRRSGHVGAHRVGRPSGGLEAVGAPRMRFGIRTRLSLLLAALRRARDGLTGLYSFMQSRELLVHAAERDLVSSTQVFGRRLTAVVRGIRDDVRLLGELEPTRLVLAGGSAADEARKSALADTFHAMLRANPEYFQVRLIGARTTMRWRWCASTGTRRARCAWPRPAAGEGALPLRVPRAAASARRVFLSKIGIGPRDGIACRAEPADIARLGPGDRGRRQAARLDRHQRGRAGGLQRPQGGPAVAPAALSRQRMGRLPDPPGRVADLRLRPGAAGADPGELQRSPAPAARCDAAGAGPLPGAEEAPNPCSGRSCGCRWAATTRESFVVLGIAEPLSEILQSTRILGPHGAADRGSRFSAIAIVLAMFAARLVTRPLNAMTQEVKRFSNEHAVGELPTGRQDEIGELARGFDEMQTRIVSTMAELDASRTHLAHMARHDNLTGLRNRSVFIDRLEHAIVSAKRNGGCLAVLFVDLDRFKHINDTHGHAVGDLALVQTARLLTSCVREVDTVARWGGDEFVILLEAMDEEHEARRVAQTLIDRFGRRMRVGEYDIDLGVSIGISMYPRDAFDAAELIQRADEAMYLSKHRQGNRYSVFGNESVK